MKIQEDYRQLGCVECSVGAGLGFDFTMAFQPIVNTTTHQVFAQEALVRGLNNESAAEIFQHVNATNRYRFDQSCRVKAIKLAAELGISTFLNINFMPNAVYRPELCIRTSLAAAEMYGFPLERILFEITESEKVDDLILSICARSSSITSNTASKPPLMILAQATRDSTCLPKSKLTMSSWIWHWSKISTRAKHVRQSSRASFKHAPNSQLRSLLRALSATRN